MLYLVPTPIGNLEDITFRAIRILQEVDMILAEDTRTSGFLLKHYNILTPASSYHAFNEHKILPGILDQLASGKNMALITDAGTPGISDPGFLLVRACISAGIQVTCLPGPVAFIPVLVSSGLPCDKFHFEGFLPHKKGRQTRWKYLRTLPISFIIYESPHRLLKCLEEIIEYCGPNRQVCVGREISKKFEELITLTATQMLEHFSQKSIKGELVLVVEGWMDQDDFLPELN